MSKLTPNDVMNIGFHKANIGGYRSDEVDIFIDKVQETFQEQNKEIENLKKKLVVLAKKIEQYRQDEDNVKTALISAQKMGDTFKKEAQKEADEILNKAKEKAEEIEKQIKDTIANKEQEIIKLQTKSAEFKCELIDVYKKHLQSIKAISKNDEFDTEVDLIQEEMDQTKKDEKESAKKVNLDTKKVNKKEEKNKTKSIKNEDTPKAKYEKVDDKTKTIDIISSDAELEDESILTDNRETKTFDAIKFGDDYNLDNDGLFEDLTLPDGIE